LLTAEQVYTWEVFNACKSSDGQLTGLRPNGGFSFEAATVHDARATMRCMATYGFTFSNHVIAESTNFGTRVVEAAGTAQKREKSDPAFASNPDLSQSW